MKISKTESPALKQFDETKEPEKYKADTISNIIDVKVLGPKYMNA